MITQNMINVYVISIKRGLISIDDITNLELKQKVQEELNKENV